MLPLPIVSGGTKPHNKLTPKPTGPSSLLRTAHISVLTPVQLWHTTQHRTVLIIFPLVLHADNHHRSDVVYCRERNCCQMLLESLDLLQRKVSCIALISFSSLQQADTRVELQKPP